MKVTYSKAVCSQIDSILKRAKEKNKTVVKIELTVKEWKEFWGEVYGEDCISLDGTYKEYEGVRIVCRYNLK